MSPPTEALGGDEAVPSPAAHRSAKRREPNTLLRFGAALALVALLLGGAAYFFMRHDDTPPPRLVREITVVKILPPPPPPPPPPKPPEPKVIEQPKMADPQIKEEKPVDRPKEAPVKDAKNDEPPGPLSLDAKAQGPGDLFNLGGKPGGSPYGGGGGGGSRWGGYISMVLGQIQSALRASQKTRNAAGGLDIRLWVDGFGHVNKVQLNSSTGNAELDAAIRSEVLGITLREPPAKDMPMPMNVRMTAHRPG